MRPGATPPPAASAGVPLRRSLPRALTEWSSYKESACGESKRASAPTPSQNPVVVLLPATSASSDGAARDQVEPVAQHRLAVEDVVPLKLLDRCYHRDPNVSSPDSVEAAHRSQLIGRLRVRASRGIRRTL